MSDTNENFPDPEAATKPAVPQAPQPQPETSEAAPTEITAGETAPATMAIDDAHEPAVAPSNEVAHGETTPPEHSGADSTAQEQTADQSEGTEAEVPAMMDSFSPEDLDSFSSEDLDDDTDGKTQDAFDAWGTTPEPEPEPEPVVSEDLLDLAHAEIASFRELRDARALVFETKINLEAFQKQVAALSESGEEGRRRGLGAWVLGDYQESARLLAGFESDPVASFTRAKALMSVADYAGAQEVYSRLASEYPDLAPPRAGVIEARLQATLATEDEEAAIAMLVAALGEAPLEFAESPEGQYLSGRRFELDQDFETALDHYKAAMEGDSSIRENLFYGGHLAERCGLDVLALEFYETLVRQLPVDSNVLMNLGVLYEDMGRDQDAAACYDIVHKAKPTESRARMYLNDAIAAMDMYYDEDRERKEDRLNQILRIPITDFELSVRARNCLNKMDINVLGDLVRRTEQELLSFKNFGETSLTEIKEILHSKGLRLGMPRDEAVASVEVHSTRTYTGEKADIYNKPISHLQLSIRARRTVEALGCLTIGDVMKHSSDELLGMPNFGVTSLQELKSALSQISLKLRGE